MAVRVDLSISLDGFATTTDQTRENPFGPDWARLVPTVVREFLKAGLVDRIQVAIVPILLGRGIRLWDDLRGFEDGYSVTSEVAPSGVTHLTFS